MSTRGSRSSSLVMNCPCFRLSFSKFLLMYSCPSLALFASQQALTAFLLFSLFFFLAFDCRPHGFPPARNTCCCTQQRQRGGADGETLGGVRQVLGGR